MENLAAEAMMAFLLAVMGICLVGHTWMAIGTLREQVARHYRAFSSAARESLGHAGMSVAGHS